MYSNLLQANEISLYVSKIQGKLMNGEWARALVLNNH